MRILNARLIGLLCYNKTKSVAGRVPVVQTLSEIKNYAII